MWLLTRGISLSYNPHSSDLGFINSCTESSASLGFLYFFQMDCRVNFILLSTITNRFIKPLAGWPRGIPPEGHCSCSVALRRDLICFSAASRRTTALLTPVTTKLTNWSWEGSAPLQTHTQIFMHKLFFKNCCHNMAACVASVYLYCNFCRVIKWVTLWLSGLRLHVKPALVAPGPQRVKCVKGHELKSKIKTYCEKESLYLSNVGRLVRWPCIFILFTASCIKIT